MVCTCWAVAAVKTGQMSNVLCNQIPDRGGEVRAMFASFDFQSTRREVHGRNGSGLERSTGLACSLQLVRGWLVTQQPLQLPSSFWLWITARSPVTSDKSHMGAAWQETTENFGIPANVFLPLLEAAGTCNTFCERLGRFVRQRLSRRLRRSSRRPANFQLHGTMPERKIERVICR